MAEYYLVKGIRVGGVAFWRSILSTLKEGEWKVRRLYLHKKAAMYLFPVEAFEGEPPRWTCDYLKIVLLDFQWGIWEDIIVRKKIVKDRFGWKYEYLEVEYRNGKKFVVFPNTRTKEYLEEKGLLES